MLGIVDTMQPKDIKASIGDLPYMSFTKGQAITEFLQRNHLTKALELGFYHGVSSCYMAAALKGVDGTLTAIDLESAQALSPNIDELLERCDCRECVEVFYEPFSYNWRLMKFIKEGRSFNFCYIDGGHDWYNTGYAFFLVDKILSPGGWLLFDDLYWTMEHIHDAWALRHPEEERRTPQVKLVWELLVRQHPNYANFKIEGNWAFAQKRPLHPGEYLRGSIFPSMKLSVEEAAEQLMISSDHLLQVTRGTVPVTSDLALKLSRLSKTNPRLWLRMQEEHDLWHSSLSLKDVLAQIEPYRPDVRG